VEAVGDLGRLLEDLAAELGGPLRDLPRPQKQRAVRLLEERGAFTYRKSAEIVAEALNVSRFTVYNYLNRDKG
jgi:predicted transcriptional regulator YheO